MSSNSRCCHCGDFIESDEQLARAKSDFGDQIFNFHVKCFECDKCSLTLSQPNAIVPDKSSLLLCLPDYMETLTSAATCRGCGRKCFEGIYFESGEVYHNDADCKPPMHYSQTFYTALTPVPLHQIQDLPPTSSSHSFASDGRRLTEANDLVFPQVLQGGPQLAAQETTHQTLGYSQYNASSFPTQLYPENNDLQLQQHQDQFQQQYSMPFQAQIHYQQVARPGSNLLQQHQIHQYHHQRQQQQQQQQIKLFHNLEEQKVPRTTTFAANPIQGTGIDGRVSSIQRPLFQSFQLPVPALISHGASSILSQPEPHQLPRQHQPHNLQRKRMKREASDSPSSPRHRSFITTAQKELLEEVWKRTRFPSTEEKISLGLRTALRPQQVQVWFQNMRSKEKREALMSSMLNRS